MDEILMDEAGVPVNDEVSNEILINMILTILAYM